MACLKTIGTASLEVGADHVRTAPSPCSGCASKKAPFTRWPVATGDGSFTDSVASPAVEVTVEVIDASYSFAAPGVNAPRDAGAPSVSDSVAGTVPPTPPGTSSTTLSAGAVVGASWPLPS